MRRIAILVRLTLRRADGGVLRRGFGSTNLGHAVICPRADTTWPDEVIAEMTLVDLAGRTSDTREVRVSVIHPPRPDGLEFMERVALFAALPWLIGFLAGGILGRRPGRQRP